MPRTKSEELLTSKLVALNLGLDIFRQGLVGQKVTCAQVDVQQVPKLEKKLADALDKLL